MVRSCQKQGRQYVIYQLIYQWFLSRVVVLTVAAKNLIHTTSKVHTSINSSNHNMFPGYITYANSFKTMTTVLISTAFMTKVGVYPIQRSRIVTFFHVHHCWCNTATIVHYSLVAKKCKPRQSNTLLVSPVSQCTTRYNIWPRTSAVYSHRRPQS